jgi:hypothetical protein
MALFLVKCFTRPALWEYIVQADQLSAINKLSGLLVYTESCMHCCELRWASSARPGQRTFISRQFVKSVVRRIGQRLLFVRLSSIRTEKLRRFTFITVVYLYGYTVCIRYIYGIWVCSIRPSPIPNVEPSSCTGMYWHINTPHERPPVLGWSTMASINDNTAQKHGRC